MTGPAYRVAEGDEKSCCEDYDELVGPGGFSCVLTEPEDRLWHRDGGDVIRELNRLHGLLQKVIRGQWSITELQEAIGDI